MNTFVILELLGSGAPVALNPAMVVSAQQFDSGRGGISTTLKMASGDPLKRAGRSERHPREAARRGEAGS
jgi:hypothetical protein